MSNTIIDTSREFFLDIVLPILQDKFPKETSSTAFGAFGLGSEVYGMDDNYSRDHHFGLRINALIPDDIFQKKSKIISETVASNLPDTYKGESLAATISNAGTALALDSFEAYLNRMIGIDHFPKSELEWLSIPEEDIIHIINGELWHDPSEAFTNIRKKFKNYYPEKVWKRRIAHWCRYCSGMGSYALKRAILRDNNVFATVAFGKTIRWYVQLGFLLDRVYFPYDKWIWHFFEKLPRMADRLSNLIEESVKMSTDWNRKLDLLDEMADVIDLTLVEDKIIKPHPKFKKSDTSGYRLLEHAYKEILDELPDELLTTPNWDQIYLESFVANYVKNGIDSETWIGLLNLHENNGDA